MRLLILSVVLTDIVPVHVFGIGEPLESCMQTCSSYKRNTQSCKQIHCKYRSYIFRNPDFVGGKQVRSPLCQPTFLGRF